MCHLALSPEGVRCGVLQQQYGIVEGLATKSSHDQQACRALHWHIEDIALVTIIRDMP